MKLVILKVMANVLVNIKSLRVLLRKINVSRQFNYNNTIMTSEFKAAEAIDELKNNPYFEKYSKKIAKLQQTSPEEFLSRLAENANKKKPRNSSSPVDKSETITNVREAKPGIPNIPLTVTKPKLLDDVFKIDLVKDKKKDEISEIWLEYHKSKDAIAATVPNNTYDLIVSRSAKYPLFLLPLPRKEGYEFIVCQFNGNEVHFTPLIAYQTHKENAPECLTIIYYNDLREDKDLILMKGEFDKNVLNGMEAQCLANQLQLYYGEENEKRTNLLERFTYQPDNFKHMDLIAELECLSF